MKHIQVSLPSEAERNPQSCSMFVILGRARAHTRPSFWPIQLEDENNVLRAPGSS